MENQKTNVRERLFCGIFPEGFSWADREVEEHGDYKKIAFLGFRDLKLTVYDPASPLLETVQAEAAKLQARRGERYRTSASGQYVILGYGLPAPDPVRQPTIRILYRSRDIGYGIHEAAIQGRWTGERDTWGKRAFQPLESPAIYLFDDEVVDETPIVIEAPPTGASVMAHARTERGGFLTEEDVAAIAEDPATRLQLLLVRCGGGRFLAPAQDVKHFIDIIERDYNTAPGVGDYVRDVSIPAKERAL